ncbi:ABI gene family member 3 [Neophocaena asiaeorientalis asiaeorientalis]|uniref:ABI gene family member 3 n=1 Tax=Neophocaena asiaeorientalis asiaeorientalis TaxID=1706337 RepID=A0A341BET4_NEOAA|nr:ABI gene family member 3 [Neophocaena asiaeorientalis asiaeorientalis]
MAELQQLQEFEIPTGREALQGNYSSLLRVADYCEDNYVQATDKRKALEETMAFTTQALASVAYQVGNLAGHTLRMLDLQASALRQVEARVSTLGQMVNMHMEKVARREIGTLATVQRLPPSQKIIAPESLPPLTPYYRRPLNFGCLDDIGHGVKVERGAPPLSPEPTLFSFFFLAVPRSTRDLSSLTSGSRHPFSLPTPRRAPRIPEPVQLPVVLDGKLSAASSASSLASAGSAEGVGGVSTTQEQAVPPPPPPPPAASEGFLSPPPLGKLCLPPTAPELPMPLDLPPPPPLDVDDLGLPPPPPPGFGPEEPSWVPDAYLEKVVTLYPYTRQKDNELSFSEGTVICITRRYSDGWCEGVCSEGSGFFPGNYVEPSC